DCRNRAEVAGDQLPQDVLYALTLYIEALGNAVRAARGTMSYVELDSVCALFGVDRDAAQAAKNALQASAAIERVIADINNRLGRQWNCKMKVAVSIHAGRAAIGEIGQSDPPVVMAIGEAVDVATALRKAVAAQDKQFAISEPVFQAAGLEFPAGNRITLRLPGLGETISASLSNAGPTLPATWRPLGEPGRRAALQRLWSGR